MPVTCAVVLRLTTSVSQLQPSRYNAQMNEQTNGYSDPLAALALSRERLMALCDARARHIAIRVVNETGSTNADLLAEVSQLNTPTLLWAHSQTAGRGRAGRNWHAPADATLTFSLAWKFGLPLQALAGLPLAVGVVVAETLTSLGIDARLKWPNDVLRDGNKLAGILIETAVDKTERCSVWAIMGVGINLTGAQELSEHLGRPVADASELTMERERLMAALLNAFCLALPLFELHGFKAFVAAWNALDAYAGKPVNILDQGNILHCGNAVGVDAAGCLLLDTAQGRKAIVAGDVSLRIRED